MERRVLAPCRTMRGGSCGASETRKQFLNLAPLV